jgi:hypothetical protein
MITGVYQQPGSVMETRIVQEGKMNLIVVNLKIGHVLVIFSRVIMAIVFQERMFVMEITIVWMDQTNRKISNVIQELVTLNLNLNARLTRHMEDQCVYPKNGYVMVIRTVLMALMRMQQTFQTVH